MTIDLIAFDADDTLWHNETIFVTAQDKFKKLLASYHTEDWIDRKLYETEARNLQHFGYGVKGFTLSMIETAIELSEGRISGTEIQTVIEFGKEMLKAPVELLEGVEECVNELLKSYRLMVITKGDLFDQEAKFAKSGLGDRFWRIEVVSDKNRITYERILGKYEVDPQRFLMVGDSLKSDILPVIALGAHAVHIPYQTTWIHERVTPADVDEQKYSRLKHIRLLPDFVAQLNLRMVHDVH
jgi:putative hydrolase of the HAD superfamily